MPERLFGTDGIRGRPGVYPLDAPTIRRLGAALVRALPRTGAVHRLLIGRDTRESGGWIEQELAHGTRAGAASVTSVGIIPTPAIAYLTRSMRFDVGVMISASHNPFEDNGIKLFSGAGEKFNESLESEVEAIVADRSWTLPSDEAEVLVQEDLSGAYLQHARQVLPDPARFLTRLKVAVDSANGATFNVAPRLFRDLGFDVTTLGCEPDGRNINSGCGSTSPEALARIVREGGHDLGVAFDGDGDRAIFVDHEGRIVDGDAVMLMCAQQLKSEGRLRGNAVVATVMSNIGLEIALRQRGIDLLRCPVGDKYVMEELIRRNLSLGGEQSGHVIFVDYLFTGDGLITALNVLRTMEATGRSLAELAAELPRYPQVLLNVPVREMKKLEEIPAVADAIARVENRLGDKGRLLVRYSGTEPLLRIMLEGQDQDEIRAWGQEIVDVVRKYVR